LKAQTSSLIEEKTEWEKKKGDKDKENDTEEKTLEHRKQNKQNRINDYNTMNDKSESETERLLKMEKENIDRKGTNK
jgi:hypothetical protein